VGAQGGAEGGTVRQHGRWYLTDVQRLFVVLIIATAVFIAAMAWGLESIPLLGVALLLLILVGLFVFLIGLRYTGDELAEGQARVLSVPSPPPGKIVSRCDLRLQVHLPGAPVTVMRHRDPSVPLTKWPRVGDVLPVDLNPRTRSLRVRWDRVESHRAEPANAAAEVAEAAIPFFIDYADAPAETAEQPTDNPGRPGRIEPQTAMVVRDQQPPQTNPRAYPDQRGNGTTRDAGDDVTPPAGPTRRGETTSGQPSRRRPWIIPEPGPAPDPSRSDGADPAPDIEADATVRFEPEPLAPQTADPVPTDPESRARAADYELPMRSIPQPRPAEPPVAASPLDGAGAMGIMLVVSDLTRSVRFYRDLVGMNVVDQAANAAVLSYGGGRVVLRQLADMSPVDRRVSHLHIKVPDVEAAYRDLVARGVQFVHVPRAITLGEKLDLWAATFRDPDGHDIALTQWRDKDTGTGN
jgi:catechol 2,3-dioxygenase-like lactoylglutathione lyase family enzyme